MMTALGWALLHSVWQGAALGLLAWALLVRARRRSAALRHHLCLGGLVLQVGALLATWAWLAHSGAWPRVEVLVAGDVPAEGVRTTLPGLGSLPGPWFALLRLGDGVAWVWCMGVALMGLRLLVGQVTTRQRFRGGVPASDAVQAMADALVRQLGLKRGAQVRLSTSVTTPMIWGVLRPVILLPASLVLQLGPDTLEAVLAHELAHLYRRDGLSLLVQRLAEALLFYHPTTWWLSRQMRVLREHGSDDLAVRLLGDPLPYAEALARLEHLRKQHIPGRVPAMAHAAQGGSLMMRIQRLLHTEADPAPAFHGLSLALMLGMAAGGVAFAQAPPPAPASMPAPEATFWFKGRELQVLGCPQLSSFPGQIRTNAERVAWRNQMKEIRAWTVKALEAQAARPEAEAGPEGAGRAPLGSSLASGRTIHAKLRDGRVVLSVHESMAGHPNGVTFRFDQAPGSLREAIRLALQDLRRREELRQELGRERSDPRLGRS